MDDFENSQNENDSDDSSAQDIGNAKQAENDKQVIRESCEDILDDLKDNYPDMAIAWASFEKELVNLLYEIEIDRASNRYSFFDMQDKFEDKSKLENVHNYKHLEELIKSSSDKIFYEFAMVIDFGYGYFHSGLNDERKRVYRKRAPNQLRNIIKKFDDFRQEYRERDISLESYVNSKVMFFEQALSHFDGFVDLVKIYFEKYSFNKLGAKETDDSSQDTLSDLEEAMESPNTMVDPIGTFFYKKKSFLQVSEITY
ncbi:MAG: hypothetical protein WC755_07990 [Candidatus Woesearchaeota archaeon]|jgi:hypothetical protein